MLHSPCCMTPLWWGDACFARSSIAERRREVRLRKCSLMQEARAGLPDILDATQYVASAHMLTVLDWKTTPCACFPDHAAHSKANKNGVSQACMAS